MYQEKVRLHTGEIQDLRGNINQLTAKLQEMEAMSDEVSCWPFCLQTHNFSVTLFPISQVLEEHNPTNFLETSEIRSIFIFLEPACLEIS